MKRIIAALLAAALLLCLLPTAVFADATVFPVAPENNYFSFSDGSGWGNNGGWSSGTDEANGIWAKSSQSDGASAAAAYVGGKLAGVWSFNVAITPISTVNDGRAVSRVQLLDRYKNPKLILTYEALAASQEMKLTWQTINSADGGGWSLLWCNSATDNWTKCEDTALNFSFTRTGETQITLTVLGNKGYSAQYAATVSADVMQVLCYAGLTAEKTTALFFNVQRHSKLSEMDYSVAADTAYADLMKNFLDTAGNRLKAVNYGYVSGTVTNTGYPLNFDGHPGAMWEATILLMAMDTYARANADKPAVYREVAQRIANSIDRFISDYSETELVTPASPPINHAMDDCGWNVMGFLLGYQYHKYLGNTAQANNCLYLAKKLFNNSYDTYYDAALGGGMWYNHFRTTKSLYAATLALAGYDLYTVTGDSQIKTRYLNIYNGIENNLRRADGLYWIGVNSEGYEGKDNPYDISEGGSCTYIGGNMCMAVLNARLGNLEKAKVTCEGIALYETTPSGALLNDRDAWNNTFFLGFFVRELVATGIAGRQYEEILKTTVQTILDNARFASGYYSAAWEGPQEPNDTGYPSAAGNYYDGERNRWGTQVYENGLYIGSTPNQAMTSATTAHVLLAMAQLTQGGSLAYLDMFSVGGCSLWPVFNREITEYTLVQTPDTQLTLTVQAASGASVSVNGQPLSGNTAVLEKTVGSARITVTSGDGKQVKTYTLFLRDACTHGSTETERVEPTCTEAGSLNTVCALCSELLSSESIPPLGHRTEERVTKEPTCTEEGVTSTVCTACKEVISTQPVAPLGHAYLETALTAPTCAVPGTMRVTCSRCDYFAIREIAQLSCPSTVFTDVAPAPHWAHDGIDFAVSHKLFNGMSETAFAPDSTMTRAMLVTVLWRMDGNPAPTAANKFTDLQDGAWYFDAVLWAAENSIVNGVTKTSFVPNSGITREQLSAILFRYTVYKKRDVSARTDLSGFADAGSISAFAEQTLSWAVAEELIGGSRVENQLLLDPKGSATRAQIAVILTRYLASGD